MSNVRQFPGTEADQPTEATSAGQEQAQAPQAIAITTTDHFGALIVGWHTNLMARIQHLGAIPEGTKVQITEGEQVSTLTLEGEVLKGFQLGLSIAAHELSQLPFTSEPAAAAPVTEGAPING